MCSTPWRARHGQVDRLAGGGAQHVERPARQLQDAALEHAALGHAQDRRPGAQAAALAVLLDQALALERRDQPRGGALGDAAGRRELGQRDRLLGLEHAHQQLGAAVDRGRARGARGAVRDNLELLFHGGIYYGRAPPRQAVGDGAASARPGRVPREEGPPCS